MYLQNISVIVLEAIVFVWAPQSVLHLSWASCAYILTHYSCTMLQFDFYRGHFANWSCGITGITETVIPMESSVWMEWIWNCTHYLLNASPGSLDLLHLVANSSGLTYPKNVSWSISKLFATNPPLTLRTLPTHLGALLYMHLSTFSITKFTQWLVVRLGVLAMLLIKNWHECISCNTAKYVHIRFSIQSKILVIKQKDVAKYIIVLT